MAAGRPSAAVIVPAFHSDRTLERSLAALCCQDYPSVQLVLVESEPQGTAERLVRTAYPAVRYIGVKGRLLPQAARNVGVRECDADLLLFTDPDIYVDPDWVSTMVAAYERYGGAIAGSLDNATNRWLDWGVHFSKFDLFMPGGQQRRWEYCASGNMLCSRRDFERVGGFAGDDMLGDLIISWKFADAGIPITFLPGASARHHHLAGLREFLGERFQRGRVFGGLRIQRSGWSTRQVVAQALLTLSGLRLARLLLRAAGNARRAGRFRWFIATLPLVAMGEMAWLAGELRGYRSWRTAQSTS